ncbi:hypothetical protein BDAP_001089 [Binucleata daphniae]
MYCKENICDIKYRCDYKRIKKYKHINDIRLRIKLTLKMKHDRPDLFVLDKKNKEITLIEVGITNFDLLTQVVNEKLRKYYLITSELALTYKCKFKIVPYVMTWDGIVTKCHKKYITEIGIQPKTEAYIQALVMRKTLKSLFHERRSLEEELLSKEPEMMSKRLIEDSQRYKSDCLMIRYRN